MAQGLIYEFVAELADTVRLPEPIVEFGSLQVETGQPNDLRGLFAGQTFIGSDMRPGPGVDRVEDLRALTSQDASVGTALCLDTLEHCADPLAACREMHRVLIDGGVCVISSVMFFPVHAYPHDYWRFTPEGMALLLEPFDEVWSMGVGHPEVPTQVVAIGRKGEGAPLPRRSAALGHAQAEYDRADGKVRVGLLQIPLRQLAHTLAAELPRAAAQRARDRLIPRRAP
jgi:SAM-dependent methyltransferase